MSKWTKCHTYLAQCSVLVLGSSPSCCSHLWWVWLSRGGNVFFKLAQEQFAPLSLLPPLRMFHARNPLGLSLKYLQH